MAVYNQIKIYTKMKEHENLNYMYMYLNEIFFFNFKFYSTTTKLVHSLWPCNYKKKTKAHN